MVNAKVVLDVYSGTREKTTCAVLLFRSFDQEVGRWRGRRDRMKTRARRVKGSSLVNIFFFSSPRILQKSNKTQKLTMMIGMLKAHIPMTERCDVQVCSHLFHLYTPVYPTCGPIFNLVVRWSVGSVSLGRAAVGRGGRVKAEETLDTRE